MATNKERLVANNLKIKELTDKLDKKFISFKDTDAMETLDLAYINLYGGYAPISTEQYNEELVYIRRMMSIIVGEE